MRGVRGEVVFGSRRSCVGDGGCMSVQPKLAPESICLDIMWSEIYIHDF